MVATEKLIVISELTVITELKATTELAVPIELTHERGRLMLRGCARWSLI